MFDLSTEEGKREFDEWQARSLAWQGKQREFKEYVENATRRLTQDPKYFGKIFVGLRTKTGYAGFVTTREDRWIIYGKKLWDFEQARSESPNVTMQYSVMDRFMVRERPEQPPSQA